MLDIRNDLIKLGFEETEFSDILVIPPIESEEFYSYRKCSANENIGCQFTYLYNKDDKQNQYKFEFFDYITGTIRERLFSLKFYSTYCSISLDINSPKVVSIESKSDIVKLLVSRGFRAYGRKVKFDKV